MNDFSASHHPATAWVNLDRIRDNFKAIRDCAGSRSIIPVLKANAYGHGAVAGARALEPLGVAMFAVAYVNEGIALRQAGISSPLLVLTGFSPPQLKDVLAFNLTPVISTLEQVEAIESLGARGAPSRMGAHLKVDTGMCRLGFSVRELEPVVHRLEEIEEVEIEGLMTHLASADEDPAFTAAQLDVFDEAVVRLETLGLRPGLVHAANSAGLAHSRDTHTAVRPGLALYGLAPRPLAPPLPIRPAMELRARVARLKTLPERTPVSYGGRFVTTRTSRIATISAGYADGIPRTDVMRSAGRVLYGAVALPVAGTVCMDLTMIDATEALGLAVGDEVTIFGDSPTAWDLADWAGTNAWQILISIGARVPRRYILGGREVDEQLTPIG